MSHTFEVLNHLQDRCRAVMKRFLTGTIVAECHCGSWRLH